MRLLLILFTFLSLSLFLSSQAHAQKKGGSSLAFFLGATTAAQDDTNSYINDLNTSGTTGTKNVGSAYELAAEYGYRFGGSIFGIMFRPSYFTQSAAGSTVKASFNGFTFFPMLRFHPLESKFMKFFMQVGVGYGSLTGRLVNGSASVDFNGGTFGALGGMGAEFCFTPSHCMNVEVNLRYLPIVRNVVTSAEGDMGGSIGQATAGHELEAASNDLGTTMGGLQGLLGYKMYF